MVGEDALRHHGEEGKPPAADEEQHRRPPPTAQKTARKSRPGDADAKSAILLGQQQAAHAAPSVWSVEPTPRVLPHVGGPNRVVRHRSAGGWEGEGSSRGGG